MRSKLHFRISSKQATGLIDTTDNRKPSINLKFGKEHGSSLGLALRG